MTMAQVKAARRRIKNDPRYSRTKDAEASRRREAEKRRKQQEMQTRKGKS